MTAPKISTQQEYQRAVQKLEELKRSDPNSTETQELAQSVEAYKRNNPDADRDAGGKEQSTK